MKRVQESPADGLHSLRTILIDDSRAGPIRVVVEPVSDSLTACPGCGRSGSLIRYGKSAPQTYRDVPFRGRPVELIVRPRIWFCHVCHEAGQPYYRTQIPDGLLGRGRGGRMTERLRDWLALRVAASTCVADVEAIAREVGMSEAGVRQNVYGRRG